MRHVAARGMSVLVMCAMIFTGTSMPNGAYAASKKAKYTISVNNINSNIVLRKGTTLQITASATVTRNGVTKSTPLKYKSSKKKVASVSKRGIIKAKKKGTTYITVYCKKKTSKKKKIKIRVGTPVSSVSVSGSNHLRKGRTNTLKAGINKKATNKNVSWWSDNTVVATVNSSGKVTAKGEGSCNIYAIAKDGSGVSGRRTVYVHSFTKDDARWVAHRGLHTSYTENTAKAFRAAGQNGNFWGCECDIYSTKVAEPTKQSSPPDPNMIDSTDDAIKTDTIDPEAEAVATEITGLGITGPLNSDVKVLDANKVELINMVAHDVFLDADDVVTTANKHYNDLTDVQKYQVCESLGEEVLSLFFDAVVIIEQYRSIDFAINHDGSFSRTMGYDAAVTSMTSEEIRSILPNVCFLKEYLDICKQYDMVPVVEIKETYMSKLATRKMVNTMAEEDMLDKTVLISFHEGILSESKAQSETLAQELGKSAPETYYLFDRNPNDKTTLAIQRGYTGISVYKSLLDDVWVRASQNHMKVGTWTYLDNVIDDGYLFEALLSGKYSLDYATVDYNIFK